MNDNITVLISAILQALNQVSAWAQLIQKARDEGRDISDAELDAQRAAYKAIRDAAGGP